MPVTPTLRYLTSPPLDGALNMAIDEAILEMHLAGKVPPTLRVFQWNRPALSLGRFQSVEREIVVERCRSQGIALVRRPTGGRAVLHQDEFTYSIVLSSAHAEAQRERKESAGNRSTYQGGSAGTLAVPTGIVAAYAFLSQGLLAALRRLDIAAELSDERTRKNPSAACFASSTQADLTTGGRKLVGSAQVWREQVVLQQGSLPFLDSAPRLFSVLKFPTEPARQQALAEYYTKTTTLQELHPGASWDTVAGAIRDGFAEALGAEIIPGALTSEEEELAAQLVREKYSMLDWKR